MGGIGILCRGGSQAGQVGTAKYFLNFKVIGDQVVVVVEEISDYYVWQAHNRQSGIDITGLFGRNTTSSCVLTSRDE